MVFVQGIVVTIWAAVLTLGGGGDNVSFLTAISLTVVIYLVGYLLFFIGYFKLILKRDDLKRSYQVPGGKTFKLIVAACGFLTSIFALIISFFPPSQLVGKSIHEYLTILSVSFVVTSINTFCNIFNYM
ncbi:amino acid permease [Paraclostridium bifermentans]|nr:amino acid permease [Paraclostridium bifermentans]